jgi:tetratricopeptide (TPR) repeat protein
MRRNLLAILTITATALLATPAAGEDTAPAAWAAACSGNDPDAKIAGCTQFIQLGEKLPAKIRTKAYNNRCLAYFLKQDYARAIADCDQAIQLDPENSNAYHNRGVALFSKGESSRAIADFNEAIRLNPQMVNAYLNRAKAYHDKGQYERALADVDEAIWLDPKNVSALT